MTIEITYDRFAGCYVGHEATRDLRSAGTTWQRAIEATVGAVGMWDWWMALSPAGRRERLAAARPVAPSL